jgi:hypothetical protein
MRPMTPSMIAVLVLLASAAAPAAAMSMGSHGGAGMAASFHGPLPPVIHVQGAVKTAAALPQSRKSCFRRRLKQLLALGHDQDLAEEEALLICG